MKHGHVGKAKEGKVQKEKLKFFRGKFYLLQNPLQGYPEIPSYTL